MARFNRRYKKTSIAAGLSLFRHKKRKNLLPYVCQKKGSHGGNQTLENHVTNRVLELASLDLRDDLKNSRFHPSPRFRGGAFFQLILRGHLFHSSFMRAYTTPPSSVSINTRLTLGFSLKSFVSH